MREPDELRLERAHPQLALGARIVELRNRLTSDTRSGVIPDHSRKLACLSLADNSGDHGVLRASR
ncbi:MAG: hypothetical protein ACXVRV_12710 [Gaiellaceae bacterium]